MNHNRSKIVPMVCEGCQVVVVEIEAPLKCVVRGHVPAYAESHPKLAA